MADVPIRLTLHVLREPERVAVEVVYATADAIAQALAGQRSGYAQWHPYYGWVWVDTEAPKENPSCPSPSEEV